MKEKRKFLKEEFAKDPRPSSDRQREMVRVVGLTFMEVPEVKMLYFHTKS